MAPLAGLLRFIQGSSLSRGFVAYLADPLLRLRAQQTMPHIYIYLYPVLHTLYIIQHNFLHFQGFFEPFLEAYTQ